METPITPVLADAPRVLIHVRGTMEPPECAFWERLRAALRVRGAELLLTAHHWAKSPIDVPVLRARNGLAAVDQVPAQQGWSPYFSGPDLDPNFESDLLARESLWNGPPADAEAETRRKTALQHYAAFYGAALKIAQPALVVIWNGQHPQEMILERIARDCGCAVKYLERACFHGSLHLDDVGILGASAVARATEWVWPEGVDRDAWLARLRSISAAYRDGGTTWWPQPPRTDPAVLRQRLGISPEDTIVLFAGQVDRDAQSMLFSPHFERNLEAFAWFCRALPERDNLFILGKHHPMSPAPPEAYREVLGKRRGAWVSDTALADCLALADRVAAVNSTVLYEGLLLGKPVLMLGKALLSGKGIAYEVEVPDKADAVLSGWLDATAHPDRQNLWEDFGAWLLATQFYTVTEGEEGVSERGAEAMAEALLPALGVPAAFSPLTAAECFADCVPLWDESRARSKKHAGAKEVLRGLNIAVEASLGRVAPSAYERLLHWGNTAYARARREKK